MSLLREIQQAVIDNNINIGSILRKCTVLAARLGNEPFKKWIANESNGYKDKAELPDYRIIKVHSQGDFYGAFGSSLRNVILPVQSLGFPDGLKEFLQTVYFVDPISTYEALISNSDGDNFQEHWPAEIVAKYSENIRTGMTLLEARKLISYGAIVTLLDVVRNKILNFVLEIESENPEAGEASLNHPPLPQEKVTQVFNTNIYGNVGNLSSGGENISQSATMNITTNDFNSLKEELISYGLPESYINDLENSIEEDDRSFGKSVKRWLRETTADITCGLISLSNGITANFITKALFQYFGIE